MAQNSSKLHEADSFAPQALRAIRKRTGMNHFVTFERFWSEDSTLLKRRAVLDCLSSWWKLWNAQSFARHRGFRRRRHKRPRGSTIRTAHGPQRHRPSGKPSRAILRSSHLMILYWDRKSARFLDTYRQSSGVL